MPIRLLVSYPEEPLTAEVDSVDRMLKKATASGRSIVVLKQAITGVGWQAYFKDPEGNVIGILENDPKTK
jgi:predicted enzyme related to lactoylglutathione lyase